MKEMQYKNSYGLVVIHVDTCIMLVFIHTCQPYILVIPLGENTMHTKNNVNGIQTHIMLIISMYC